MHKRWSTFPQMEALSADTVRSMDWLSTSLKNPFKVHSYAFEDASNVMLEVSQQFGKVRDIQCQDLKDGLVEMDPRGIGRVPLKSFYTKKAIGHWTLTESPEYLRQLGVLDESVPKLGPQLVIPNYVTAVYSICCIHECGDILNPFEA